VTAKRRTMQGRRSTINSVACDDSAYFETQFARYTEYSSKDASVIGYSLADWDTGSSRMQYNNVCRLYYKRIYRLRIFLTTYFYL